MLPRISAFVIWALVAATAMFWGLRLIVSAPQAPANAVAVGDSPTLRGDMARVLGSAPTAEVAEVAAPEAASRFKLIGVMAPRPHTDASVSDQGVALIAVDGKPAKAYAVGSKLDGELVLQSVSLRAASISAAPGQPPLRLELPALPPPSTGTLPALAAVPMVPAPVMPPAPQMQPMSPQQVPISPPPRAPSAMAQ